MPLSKRFRAYLYSQGTSHIVEFYNVSSRSQHRLAVHDYGSKDNAHTAIKKFEDTGIIATPADIAKLKKEVAKASQVA